MKTNFSKNILCKNFPDYIIGIDIGTNSVGWAVFGTDYKLLKKNGKRMWGANLSDAGETAVSRRALRSMRRRYERRKERIRLLQMLTASSVNEKDENFFMRLEKSFLLNVSKDTEFGRDNLYNLFDGDYTDKDFYKQNRTIYHLRERLCSSTEKEDIRLVYLAMHHIIKYRGNFLHEAEEFKVNGDNLSAKLNEFFELYNVYFADSNDGTVDEFDRSVNRDKFFEILLDKKKRKGQRREELLGMWEHCKEYSKRAGSLIDLLLGYKADLTNLFNLEVEDKEKYKISFADSDFDEKQANFPELFRDEVTEMMGVLYALYMNLLLIDVLGEGNERISQGMIDRYEKHKLDLKTLKNLLKSDRSVYDDFFKSPRKSPKAGINFTNYFKTNTKRTLWDFKTKTKVEKMTQKDFYNRIKEILEAFPESAEKKYCLDEIEKDNFLIKLNTVKNAAIPYQMNLNELKLIIKNQGRYYPQLIENAEKIISILTFKRPYSVGVINPESRFSWADEQVFKLKGERAYPWNFEEIVDIDSLSEKFVTRMTGKCSYIKEEPVLPKCSIIYQKYNVLNELANVRIIENCGVERNLTVKEAKKMFEILFLKKPSASKKDLIINLYNEFDVKVKSVEGLSDEKKFVSKMSSYRSLETILGVNPFENLKLCEDIIECITVYSDRKIRKRTLLKLGLSENIVARLANLNFKGWGRLSKKLLCEIVNQKNQSIIDCMEETNKNFMSVTSEEGLGFKNQLDEYKIHSLDKLDYKKVDDLYLSPSVKRSVWQAVKIVKEIIKICGKDPKGIYIESTRTDENKKKAKTRKEKIKELYNNIKKEVAYYNNSDKIKFTSIADEKLNNDMIYLYCRQMGRSMYSEKPLGDIALLSQNCEIDHIVPRCYLKDDSLDNRVLVLKEENQIKSGDLAITKEIRENRQAFWQFLYEHKFISKRKLTNLSRDGYDENELKSFINRQLVETNQSIKSIRDLFSAFYTDTDVEMVKAGISSVFRGAMAEQGYDSFFKLRNVNDMHHAKDAYLAGAIAYFTRKIYPIWGKDNQARLLKEDIKSAASGVTVRELVNRRHGIVVDAMRFGKTDSYKSDKISVDWNTCFNNILKTFEFNDCLITKKTEITAEGAFYDATIYSPLQGVGNIPLRFIKNREGELKPLPLSYGNHSNQNSAYFIFVTFKKGKKINNRLMGVPVLISYQQMTDKNAVWNYFKKVLSEKGSEIVSLGREIRKHQLIKFGGQFCYITSHCELINAIQYIPDSKFNLLLYCMEHPNKRVRMQGRVVNLLDDQEYFEDKLKEFALYHIQKIKNHYPLYEGHAKNALEYLQNGKFDLLPYFESESHIDKLKFIAQLVELVFVKSKRLNMSMFGGGSNCGRLNSKIIERDCIDIIDQSITGIYQSVIYSKNKEM